MGIFESIVVVYLRKIYYPNGFQFPLAAISDQIIRIELLREACTLAMLIAVAWLAGKNRLEIFSFFLLSFAVWDIVYYAGLKFLLNWPSSLYTWDILFLIPVPWVGPVISPIITSLTMILLAYTFLIIQNHKSDFKLRLYEWLLIYLGAFLIFISFIWDYSEMMINNLPNMNYKLFTAKNSIYNTFSNYIPSYFHWNLFLIGIISICFSIFLIIRRNGKKINL